MCTLIMTAGRVTLFGPFPGTLFRPRCCGAAERSASKKKLTAASNDACLLPFQHQEDEKKIITNPLARLFPPTMSHLTDTSCPAACLPWLAHSTSSPTHSGASHNMSPPSSGRGTPRINDVKSSSLSHDNQRLQLGEGLGVAHHVDADTCQS